MKPLLASVEPAVDVLIARKLHTATRALLDAREIATAAKRADDGRDVGIVLGVLAQCARRVDSRETRSRVVVAFRPPGS